MDEAARKINYPSFESTTANDAEFYQLKPGKRKVISLDEKRIAKTSSQDRKRKSSSYASKTKNLASQADSDRVGYLRDRYGIDVQPDQLSPHNNQVTSLKPSSNSVATYPHVSEPIQRNYRDTQEKPKRIRVRNESDDSSSGVLKKTRGLFTGFMLTSIALVLYKLHLAFALVSTAAFGAIGVAAITVRLIDRFIPDFVTSAITSIGSVAANLLGIQTSLFNPFEMFFLLYFFHFFYGLLVVGIIAVIAIIRRSQPFGGEWFVFKISLAFFVILMHMIPVANLLVIIPTLIWIWLIAFTR